LNPMTERELRARCAERGISMRTVGDLEVNQ
jgi:hypothetical protein